MNDAIGFDNETLVEAILHQPERGMGRDFIAFVIPKHCKTVRQEGVL